MSEAFTPGPWVMTGGSPTMIIAPGLADICEMQGAATHPGVVADAHLISSAPELYEALKSALQTAKFEKHPFRAWHHEAAAALAKAKGKA